MSQKYAIRNPYRFPLASVHLGSADTGGVTVEGGGVVTDIDPEVAERVCATGCFQISRNNGITFELDGKYGPNGERDW